MAKTAYIAFGSNMGDREAIICHAYAALNLVPGIRTEALSEMYVTKPWGYTDQPDFVNACCRIDVELSPEALLGVCLGIEAAEGRVREFKNGPRVLDMDLLLYEGETRDTPELRLPHPGLLQREFVLLPLKDVCLNGFACGVDVQAAIDRLQKV